MTNGAFLVTGGSCGIGSALVAALNSAGHPVGVITRDERAGRSRLRDLPHPERVQWLSADLNDGDETSAAVNRWGEQCNWEVDGIVLSAVCYGRGGRHSLQTTDLSEWDQINHVNLRSQYLLASIVLPRLVRRPRALILSVCSSAAFQAAPGRAAYAASKAGAFAFLSALAEELRDTRVSVVQVMPKNQVATPGLAARRPHGFSFEGYDSPNIFRPFMLAALDSLGSDMHGRLMVVGADGTWVAADGGGE